MVSCHPAMMTMSPQRLGRLICERPDQSRSSARMHQLMRPFSYLPACCCGGMQWQLERLKQHCDRALCTVVIRVCLHLTLCVAHLVVLLFGCVHILVSSLNCLLCLGCCSMSGGNAKERCISYALMARDADNGLMIGDAQQRGSG
jgi:hypothetical protein